jgi:serine/threonine protein kinase
MKPPQIWKIASVVADILDYLHGLSPQIVHRDLTPDNLIFADGKITLIDFGAASEYVSGLTGTMIGKQCYIPPEQFQGHATTKSDLYALGCTLYFIATGKDPEPIEQSMPETGDRLLDLLIADLTVLDPDQRLADARTVINRASSRVAKIAEVVSV